MNSNHRKSVCSKRSLPRSDRHGVVLVLTLMVLVVLAGIGYSLSMRLAAQRNRDQYIIDYQKARYGCDSALKYAFAMMETTEPNLIERPNEPDFSDLFALDNEQYIELLTEWAPILASYLIEQDAYTINNTYDTNNIADINKPGSAMQQAQGDQIDPNDPNTLFVRGPYGVIWPNIIEPIELSIGQARIKIQIEDENAKLPILWATNKQEFLERESAASIETFCEWMEMDPDQIASLQSQLGEVGEIKNYAIKIEDENAEQKKASATEAKKTKKKISAKTARELRLERLRQARERRGRKRRKKKSRPAAAHTTDFARLLHSGIVDVEPLARPVILSEKRSESAIKYIGLWGSSKINVNTAPRHVLEAAFTFSGDAAEIADEIIERRRIKPFDDIEKMKNDIRQYSNSIEKVQSLLITKSSFFTIKITAVSGQAKAKAVAGILKDKTKITKIGVFYD